MIQLLSQQGGSFVVEWRTKCQFICLVGGQCIANVIEFPVRCQCGRGQNDAALFMPEVFLHERTDVQGSRVQRQTLAIGVCFSPVNLIGGGLEHHALESLLHAVSAEYPAEFK